MWPSPTGTTLHPSLSRLWPAGHRWIPFLYSAHTRLWGALPEASCGTPDNLSQTLCPCLFDTHLKLFNHTCVCCSPLPRLRALSMSHPLKDLINFIWSSSLCQNHWFSFDSHWCTDNNHNRLDELYKKWACGLDAPPPARLPPSSQHAPPSPGPASVSVPLIKDS